MTAQHFSIRPGRESAIRWSARGSCGNAGCTDPECCCAVCGKPIGVDDEDPRWDEHDEYCDDCDLCRDRVPLMMFRGEGKAMLQASFHTRCFESVVEFRKLVDPVRIIKDAAFAVGTDQPAWRRRFTLQLLANVQLYLEDPEMYIRFRRQRSVTEMVLAKTAPGSRGVRRTKPTTRRPN